jgi:hypothetical protein
MATAVGRNDSSPFVSIAARQSSASATASASEPRRNATVDRQHEARKYLRCEAPPRRVVDRLPVETERRVEPVRRTECVDGVDELRIEVLLQQGAVCKGLLGELDRLVTADSRVRSGRSEVREDHGSTRGKLRERGPQPAEPLGRERLELRVLAGDSDELRLELQRELRAVVHGKFTDRLLQKLD